jgi:alpha-ribazole phosphatase/probable phosphoglycerate mutase
MRIYVLTRHGESTLNHENRINGDPSLAFGLTEDGREQARALGVQIAHLPLERCVVSRFPRTHETAAEALRDRDVPVDVEPLLDDINVGELEGRSIEDYRAWRHAHGPADCFPGGESLSDAGRRYARAFELLLEHTARTTLVVCHEIPLRYALNGAAGSNELDGPVHVVRNATPYVFDEAALGAAARHIGALAAVAT